MSETLSTKEKIVAAALKLFSKKGVDSVSVRDITQAAKVNLSAISYYFGGKQGLIEESVTRCLDPINRYRLKLLSQEIKKRGSIENIPVHDLFATFIRPMIIPKECGVSKELFMQLVARYFTSNKEEIPHPTKELYREVLLAYSEAFKIHFPDLETEAILKRLLFSLGMGMYYLGFAQTALHICLSNTQTKPSSEETLLEEVISFCLEGFSNEQKAL